MDPQSVVLVAQSVGAGVASGAVAALLGYAKNAAQGEDFALSKTAPTMMIGAFVGGVAAYTGQGYESAYTWLGSIGAITVVEYTVKAIWRRVGKYFEPAPTPAPTPAA